MLSPLGLTQSLTAAGEGYNQAYFGALGTLYQRGLAQQKQNSESALQAAQADYFSGRNGATVGAANDRMQGQIGGATIRANGAANVANINAYPKLIADFPAMANQPLAAQMTFARQLDAQHGTNYSGENNQPQGGQGGPGPPYTDPVDGTIKFGAPPPPQTMPGYSQGSGIPPTLPPPAGPVGMATAPSLSFSAPGVGLSGMGRNTLPAPQVTGVSPALPPPSGPAGNMPVGMPPALPPPGPIGSQPPAQTNGNLFNPSPLMLSQVRKNNASAAGSLSKTDLLFQNSVGLMPPTQQAQATARFNQINGTNYAVPGTQNFPVGPNGQQALGPPALTPSYTPNALQASTIGRNAAQAGMDTSLGNAATVGGQVKQMTAKQQGLYQDGLLKLRAQGLSDTESNAIMENQYRMGMLDVAKANSGTQSARLGLDTQKYLSPNTPGGKNGGMTATQDDALAKQSISNEQSAARLRHMLDSGKGPDGTTALSVSDMAMMQHEVISLQQRNAEINRRRESGASALNGSLPVNPVSGGYGLIPNAGSSVRGISGPSVPALPNFPGAGGSGNKYLSMTPAQLRALARQRGVNLP